MFRLVTITEGLRELKAEQKGVHGVLVSVTSTKWIVNKMTLDSPKRNGTRGYKSDERNPKLNKLITRNK